MSALHLRNPHSVLAAIEARPGDVLEVQVPPRSPSEAWKRVVHAAQQAGVKVTGAAPVESRPRRGEEKSSREGGAVGIVRERSETPLDDLFAGAKGTTGIWLALDSLQDPHNVGAIFRTAAFFGVRGVVLTSDRSAPLSAVVYDTASGGLEAVPFHQSTNLNRALELAKDAGLWTLGTAEEAPQDISEVVCDRPWLVVLGSEERGLRRLVREHCDELRRIAPRGAIGSLNVSVAAGVVLGLLTRGGRTD